MQSTVHLFNTALARLGGEQLALNISPREQSNTGRICANLFPHILDMALAVHAWAFALRREALASRAPAGNPEYPFSFELPTDCVKPVRLEGYAGVGRAPAYVLEGRTLRAGAERAVLLYIARISDPALWPALFADALAWALAGELASAVNNDPQKQQWCYQNHRIALADAIAQDQADQRPKRKQGEWTAARFGEGE